MFQVLLVSFASILFVIFFFYLTRTIRIYKSLNKYFYFAFSCLGLGLYNAFQYQLSLPHTDFEVLVLHKLKLVGVVICGWATLYTIFTAYLPKTRFVKYFFYFSVVYYFLIPFDFYTSYPITRLEIKYWGILFNYSFAKTHIVYSIYSVTFLSSFAFTMYKAFRAKTRLKNKVATIIITLVGIVGGLNDFAVSHELYKAPMIMEFIFFIYFLYMYFDFLNDDLTSHKKLIKLNEELSTHLKMAEERLRITEVYTTHTIVNFIEKGKNPTLLVPERQNLIILFADIRNFTELSEDKEALAIVNILNTYFETMNQTIQRNHGEIDKLIGDGIMAVFTDPEHAIKAAIDMRLSLIDINRKLSKKYGIHIDNGIGINSGEAIIGNIGSNSKMDFTVIGNIVNSASRLESLTKKYQTPILISDDFRKRLSKNHDIRFIDRVVLKGKKNITGIYEVYDYDSAKKKTLKRKIQKRLDLAYDAYLSGNIQTAKELYCELKYEIDSYNDESFLEYREPLLDFYIQRCLSIIPKLNKNFLSKWNGVYHMATK